LSRVLKCEPACRFRRLRLPGEDLSQRDLVKVAQYEVLGNDEKRYVRPVRDDRYAWLLVSRVAKRVPGIGRSSRSAFVPQSLKEQRRRPDYGGQAGTDSALKNLTQHFVLGYFRQVPAGRIFSNPQTTRAILIAPLKLTLLAIAGYRAIFIVSLWHVIFHTLPTIHKFALCHLLFAMSDRLFVHATYPFSCAVTGSLLRHCGGRDVRTKKGDD